MKTSHGSVFAIPWFRQRDWKRFLRLFVDAATFPRDRSVWLASTQWLVGYLEAEGIVPVVVCIDPSRFENWCAERDLRPNSRVFMTYVRRCVGGN